jgi:hypothetical protein
MASMNHFGIKGPTGMLHVYYYACKLELDRKLRPDDEALGYSGGEEGVEEPECSMDILDNFGDHCGIARWLYSSALTSPHESNEWRSWYLSKIIKREGWTLLDSMNDTTKLPDGSKVQIEARNR